MKRILPFTLILICLSCLKEEDADPGKPMTFIRYFNGGFDDVPEWFEETPDKGFTILASTEVPEANASILRSKIKLIKTDQYGNTVWQSLFPAFQDEALDIFYYKGHDFLVETDDSGTVTGYTIVGDSIDAGTGVPYFFLIQTDANGVFDESRTKSLPAYPNMRGQSIAKDSNGDYIVLGLRSGYPDDMILAKINKTTLKDEWIVPYGSGESSNLSKVYVEKTGDPTTDLIYWGGTVKRDFAYNQMRFVKTQAATINAKYDLTYGTHEAEEEASEVSPVITSKYYLLAGTTEQLGSKDILFRKVSSEGGGEDLSAIIGESNTNEEGDAVTATSDGYVILGTTGIDEEKDYFVVKLNVVGDVLWTKSFGSDKEEQGVGIKQISDGSYVILGASRLGSLGGVMLMKIDTDGNFE